MQSVLILVLLLLTSNTLAATSAENRQLYEHSRKVLSDMQKRVWEIKKWWVKKSTLDTAARRYAFQNISPLLGVDDYFVAIDRRIQNLYKAYTTQHLPEADFQHELDGLIDDALNKLYWSYVFHIRSRIKDMKNSYTVDREALVEQYHQQLTFLQKQYGRLSEESDERARRLLAAVANQELTLRNNAKAKYVKSIQEAVLLRRHLSLQMLDWINTLKRMKRNTAAKFFNMRLYDLLEYQLAKTSPETLAQIFAPELWGGKSVEWVKHNGSAFDRDLLTSRQGSFTFLPMKLPFPGPSFMPTNQTVEIGETETLRLRDRFVQEPVKWLIQNHTIQKAI